jgi:hypothetical protein
MWDNHQPSTVKEIQTVLFLRKLPCHIRNLINQREFKELEDLIQRCNEIWEDQGSEEAAATAVAITSLTPPSETPAAPHPRSARRGLPATDPAAAAHGPPRGDWRDRLCFYQPHFKNKAQKCEKGCSYQEN